MKGNILIKLLVIAVVVMGLGLGGLCLYQYAGLKYYIKAAGYIDQLPEASRSGAWKDFIGTTSDRYYNGIYAGDFMGRVWVWGKSGLRSFATSQYTIYSFFDGCTDKFLNSENHVGEGLPILDRSVTTDKSKWKNKASAGDLTQITIASEVKPGTLKEISNYNFWYFIQKDQITECAR